jgi:osmotically-inducible protein OsmY
MWMKHWTGAIIVGLAVVACSGSSTEDMVRDVLTASGIADVEVQVARDAIRLTGTVETLADRSRAVELAASVVGPSTPVENDIAVSGLGPLGESRTEPQPAGPQR